MDRFLWNMGETAHKRYECGPQNEGFKEIWRFGVLIIIGCVENLSHGTRGPGGRSGRCCTAGSVKSFT